MQKVGRPAGAMAMPLPTVAFDEMDNITWTEVADFEAGRMRLAQDHNGNVELTIRIPPDFRKDAYGVTDYAGVRLRVQISVPEQVATQ